MNAGERVDLKCEYAYYSMGPIAEAIKEGLTADEARKQITGHLDDFARTGSWLPLSCARALMTAFGL